MAANEESSWESILDNKNVIYQSTETKNGALLSFPGEKVNAKKQLQHLASQLRKVTAEDCKEKTYEILSSEDEIHRVDLPQLSSGQGYRISYKNTFQANLSTDHRMFTVSGLSGPKVPGIAYIGVTSSVVEPDEPFDNFKDREGFRLIKANLAGWEYEWKNSKARKAIIAFLQAQGGQMGTVTKVMGIGLGNPGAKQRNNEQSYFQHLTLILIAKELGGLPGNKDIEIIVQDPAYTNLSRAVLAYLEDKFGRKINILKDPEAFLKIDSSTMLFHCHLTFDAADLALSIAGKAGLAGLLGSGIDVDHQAKLTDKYLSHKTATHHLVRLNSTKYKWAKSCQKLVIGAANKKWYGKDAYFYIRNTK